MLSERDILGLGAEYQQYTLNDWWPQAGGAMGPNTFWNVDFGTRDRIDAFGEWEAFWNPRVAQPIRRSQRYRQGGCGTGAGLQRHRVVGSRCRRLQCAGRQHTDHNWDLTALARYTPSEARTFEAGYARKSHSPNLYQRYPWSTQPMASLMNNFVGDGNGYIGNVDLKPEVAHTLSATGDWHDAGKEQWDLKATGYYTYVQDYIDARRCDFGQCGGTANVTATTGFVNLQYVNQSARLYGLDLSGHMFIKRSGDYGSFTGSGFAELRQGREPDHRRQSLQHHAAERETGRSTTRGDLDQHRRSSTGRFQNTSIASQERDQDRWL